MPEESEASGVLKITRATSEPKPSSAPNLTDHPPQLSITPLPTTHIHRLAEEKVYLFALSKHKCYLPQTLVSSRCYLAFSEKLQTCKREKLLSRDKIINTVRLWGDSELLDGELKATMINMLKFLLEKGYNMHDQKVVIRKDMGTIRNRQMKILGEKI